MVNGMLTILCCFSLPGLFVDIRSLQNAASSEIYGDLFELNGDLNHENSHLYQVYPHTYSEVL